MKRNWTRRSFIKNAAAFTGAAALPGFLSGCATVPEVYEGKSMDRILAEGPRVMWIAPHPDDEILVGSILAKSSLAWQNPLKFLVLTHGDGGACHREEGCEPNLAAVRHGELLKVVDLYRAELQHEKYFNAPLPVESFPKRHEIAEIWKKVKDPTLVCAEAIRDYKPDLVFTFDPDVGASGHPEHQLTSRFAMAGIRAAAEAGKKIGDLPAHRVTYTYHGLSRHWVVRMFGAGDPLPVTEVWDATQPCMKGKPCFEVMADFTKPHRSQAADMGAVREVRQLMRVNYLRKVDPFSIGKDPYEKT